MSLAREAVRKVFDRLPQRTRDEVRDQLASIKGLRHVKRNQALLATRLADLERRDRRVPREPSTDARFPPGLLSRICTQDQFDEPWFSQRCSQLGEQFRWSRKLWEHAYIVRSLDELGVVGAGRRGLGFGVGRERLVAWLAGRGCQIVATDLDPTAFDARAWTETGQHAVGLLDALRRPELCDPEDFDRLVVWRAADMRVIPSDLSDFDFCWSACALEHLGSLDAGFTFIERSLETLRPGGIAVHTTEFNVSSDDRTATDGPTVLYRRRDLEAFRKRLERDGHQMAALELDQGTGLLDQYVDVPPFGPEPLLRLSFRNFAITSVALLIRKEEAGR